jgi:hypothetical protein
MGSQLRRERCQIFSSAFCIGKFLRAKGGIGYAKSSPHSPVQNQNIASGFMVGFYIEGSNAPA